MHPMINIAIKAARKSGKIILNGLNNLDNITVQEKSKNNFVSNVDKSAERAILEIIRLSYPDHGIIAEESGTIAGNEFTWVIDPLDGTTNFLHGFPHFCTSIGILQNGVPTHGVVYDPLRDELFTATLGEGAMLNQRRLRLKDSVHLDGGLIGTGFPYAVPDQIEKYLQMFREICPRAAGIRRAGSAALDLCYIAAGRLDGFWELGLSPWDIAAGAVIVKEAGGKLSDFRGGTDFLTTGNIVAGSPKVHNELQPIIRDSIGR
ncbi:MAG: inositol monophosphatase [Legionellales bacterium]|nr:inositol monophosphatase [Legionellales bacterium]